MRMIINNIDISNYRQVVAELYTMNARNIILNEYEKIHDEYFEKERLNAN